MHTYYNKYTHSEVQLYYRYIWWSIQHQFIVPKTIQLTSSDIID